MSGVRALLEQIEASAPAFNNLSTKPAWPFKVAALKAVCVPAGVFTGAPLANSKSTTSVWPFATALMRAVKPLESWALALAPASKHSPTPNKSPDSLAWSKASSPSCAICAWFGTARAALAYARGPWESGPSCLFGSRSTVAHNWAGERNQRLVLKGLSSPGV